MGKNNLCYSFSKNFAKIFKVFAYNLKLYDKSWQFLTSGSYNLSLTWNQASVAQSTLNFIWFLSQKSTAFLLNSLHNFKFWFLPNYKSQSHEILIQKTSYIVLLWEKRITLNNKLVFAQYRFFSCQMRLKPLYSKEFSINRAAIPHRQPYRI